MRAVGALRRGTAVALFEEPHLAVVHVVQDSVGEVALQEPQPTLLAGDGLPTSEDIRARAAQQRVRLAELPDHASLAADTLDDYLASAAS